MNHASLVAQCYHTASEGPEQFRCFASAFAPGFENDPKYHARRRLALKCVPFFLAAFRQLPRGVGSKTLREFCEVYGLQVVTCAMDA